MKKYNSSDNIRKIPTKKIHSHKHRTGILLSMIRKIKKEQKQTNKKLNFIIDLLTNKKELSITHFSIDIPYLIMPTITQK